MAFKRRGRPIRGHDYAHLQFEAPHEMYCHIPDCGCEAGALAIEPWYIRLNRAATHHHTYVTSGYLYFFYCDCGPVIPAPGQHLSYCGATFREAQGVVALFRSLLSLPKPTTVTTTTTIAEVLASPVIRAMMEEQARAGVRCKCGELDGSGLWKQCAGAGETYSLTYTVRLSACTGCGKDD